MVPLVVSLASCMIRTFDDADGIPPCRVVGRMRSLLVETCSYQAGLFACILLFELLVS